MSERTWLKRKYSIHKQRGRFSSSHNDSRKKIKKVGSRASTPKITPNERVMVIDGRTGARRWEWRKQEK